MCNKQRKYLYESWTCIMAMMYLWLWTLCFEHDEVLGIDEIVILRVPSILPIEIFLPGLLMITFLALIGYIWTYRTLHINNER